ncbi:LysR substrate-binding domain-containing protein [Paenibacillus thalictri]|uniref:LysR family transcriptional regulator n=1 Tax=Paenibacillus thalictri TaxID=2527873 RepID=A0A4Q9DGM0_9BACL|nr:LysR substrate-binding domain-containing protein [Paenibacillus thalictri]TBL69677.1 LysR family transcriptional regulator [Paenibacillus thalictri]
MNFHLLKLKIVELLERHKKITSVADALDLRQPTVSFHMKSLEQELGVQLFESRGGKTFLTEAGLALHHYAVKINALAYEAERVVKEFQVPGRGSLKLGASYVPGTYLLPGLLCSFAKLYPHITVSLTVKTAPVIKEMLVNHEIDLAVFSAEPFQLAPLAADTLCEDEMVVVFAAGHKLGQEDKLTPEMLAKLPFVMHSPDSSTGELTAKWMHANQVSLQAAMQLDSLETIKQMVIQSDAVSFLSKLAVHRELERGELICRPIPESDFKRYILYAINENRLPSVLLDAFLRHLLEGRKEG